MGLLGIRKSIDNAVNQGAAIAKEAIIDKDKQIELINTLETLRAQSLLTGKGASITKITICALVSAIVVTGLVKFWVNPVDLILFKDLVLSLTPVVGILIGVYGSGKAFKGSRWSRKDDAE
jgi:hypothetical protein